MCAQVVTLGARFGHSPLATRRNLRSPSHEGSIRLMEEQFIHFPVRPEVELHPQALKLVDDKGSALVGTELVGWWLPNVSVSCSSLSCPTTTVVPPLTSLFPSKGPVRSLLRDTAL
jgi:hypothetical protein